MKILLCDDEPDILLVTSMVLERIGGQEVIQASGGAEAIEAARLGRPDAIVIDVMMPDMDGTEVQAKLLEDPATRDIPVVFLTAKTAQSDVDRLRALGVKGVIGKPFDPFTIATTLERILAS